MGIMIERIGFIAGLHHAGQTVDRHVHQTELGVVLHLFLTVEGHGIVGHHACMVHEIAGLNKHTATSAGRVQQDAGGGLQNIDDHLDQRFGRKEHSIVRCDVLCKFIEKILIDATDHIAAHIVQRIVVEDTKQFSQQLIREHGVLLRQDAGELLALLLHKLHGIVDHFAQTTHDFALTVQQSHGGDVLRQIHQIIILGLLGQKQRTLFGKVAGFYRHHSATAHGAILQDLSLHLLEPAVCIAQEQQAKNRHTILIGGQFGTRPQQVGRFPQISL